MWIVVTFALIAALCSASSAVMQRHASGQVAAGELFRRQIIRSVMHRKLWLAGVGLQVLGFFAIAIALHSGPLILVVPLSTTSLIFMMLLLHFATKVQVGLREWLGAFLVAGGLSGLIVTANPRNGVVIASFWGWMILLGVVGAIILAGAIFTRKLPSPNVRGALSGAVAGLHFSLSTAITKLVVAQLQYGVWHEFADWPLYALIVVGCSSAISMQSMYGAGPLAYSQPGIDITENTMGIVFGLVMFHEVIDHDIPSLALAAFCAAVLLTGVTLLASSKRLRL